MANGKSLSAELKRREGRIGSGGWLRNLPGRIDRFSFFPFGLRGFREWIKAIGRRQNGFVVWRLINLDSETL